MASLMQSLVGHYRTEFLESNEDSQANFESDVESWARVHGLVMGNGQPTPFTLVPHPIKREVFAHAMNLGPLFGRLVHQVSLDPDFIHQSLKNVEDPFTGRLLKIYETVIKEGVKQSLAMGIHRSDYMIHKGEKLLQVEINTISSAYGSLTQYMSMFHHHLINQWGNIKNGVRCSHLDKKIIDSQPVPNDSLKEIAQLFKNAVDAYLNTRKIDSECETHIAVLMIVQPGERNSIDQRFIQYQLSEDHGIHLLRHCLGYVHRHAQINSQTGALLIDGYEIAVAYYRAGYTPNDYPTESEWEARLTVERSLAIKCPNIAYHLVGTKKMQQVLAMPGQVERFITVAEDAEMLRSCFAGLYSLDDGDPGVEEVIQKAIQSPYSYVMKPQREGGGNLLSKHEMVQALKTLSPEVRSDYILMDRIEPDSHNTVLFRESKHSIAPCVTELGIFCLVLADSSKEITNKAGGWLLRSKPNNVEDGGVSAGRAYLDSPFLI